MSHPNEIEGVKGVKQCFIKFDHLLVQAQFELCAYSLTPSIGGALGFMPPELKMGSALDAKQGKNMVEIMPYYHNYH